MGWLMNHEVTPKTEGGSVPCEKLPGLSAAQSRLCELYSDHMLPITLAARLTIRECQHQFMHRRWNCTAIDDPSVFGPVAKIGELIEIYYTLILDCKTYVWQISIFTLFWYSCGRNRPQLEKARGIRSFLLFFFIILPNTLSYII